MVRSVRALSERLEPELADLLQQLCRDGLDAQQMLGGNLEGEVMAVLDVLEPVAKGEGNASGCTIESNCERQAH
jgi:hypothetical protein